VNLLRLVAVFFRIGLMSEMAYRANFLIQLLQATMTLATALAALAVVFSHTEHLGGWKAVELVALLGVFLLVGGLIGLVIQPSMERFMQDVRQGTLDYTLTKPEDAQLLVCIGEMRTWRLADVALGLLVLGVATVELGTDLGPLQILTFAATLAAGGVIVYSFWIILATLTFWFVKIENILVIFQSMYDAGRWPVDLYPRWLRTTLTFLVPIAFAVTVPSEALVGRLTIDTLVGAVVLAAAMLVLSRLVWRRGVKRYAGASA
jgi:ABC-2 type transport system permease protein